MGHEGISFVLILGAGALLLRPGDVPLFARAAGRLVGLTVRSIRTTKEAAEKAITHSATVAHQQNPDMIVMRENLKQSLQKFQDLTNTVRRDMADVPLNPASLFTNGLRSWHNQARNQNRNETNSIRYKHGTDEHASMTDPHLDSSENVKYSKPLQVKSSIEYGDPSVSGGDLLSRAIEEHALALQKRQLFTQTQMPDGKTALSTPKNGNTDA